jgi:hypothetical protein
MGLIKPCGHDKSQQLPAGIGPPMVDAGSAFMTLNYLQQWHSNYCADLGYKIMPFETN